MKNILLIGYGKMGKAIEQIALNEDHNIVNRINAANAEILLNTNPEDVDVAIEFSSPETAFHNIKTCIEKQIPVVSGTTGWLERKQEIENLCKEKNSAFFYASNYSIGMNIFFKLNQQLAKLMNSQKQYHVAIEETHHIQKLDAPSGTAITLAEEIINNLDIKNNWKLVADKNTSQNTIEIETLREPNVPGTHKITYSSIIDAIEIKHTAHSREGFAKGALMAAIWLIDKSGVFGMNDLLDMNN